jgi:hypothetical protein
MAILIHPKGLLWGKRLRKLSNKARLYYPLMLGLTNFYARIELDEPCILSNFTSFRDPDLTEENLALWFNEYTDAGLSFLYKAGTQKWIQFDTPLAMRKSFPTAEDNASPAPPEAEYTAWLQSIHGDKWKDYDLTNYQRERQSDISVKRSEAGRKGAAATNAKRWGTNGEAQQNQQTDFAESANQQSRLVVVPVAGEVAGEGEGEGEEAESLIYNLKGKTGSGSTFLNQSQSETGTAKTEAPIRGSGKANIPAPKDEKDSAAPAAPSDGGYDLDDTAAELARAWNLLMQCNEKFDPSKLPAKWETLWTADFRKLLDFYPHRTVEELMAYSQSDSQRQYNWNCKVFYGNCERNLKFMENLKKTNKWKPVLERYVAIVTTGSLPPEEQSLDDTKESTTGFNIEDEADELDDDELDDDDLDDDDLA